MNHKYTIIAIAGSGIVLALIGIALSSGKSVTQQSPTASTPAATPTATGQAAIPAATPTQQPAPQNSQPVAQPPATTALVVPLDRGKERVTKKPFGIYITKATSPVQPERFSGYHTGVDFETFPEEQNIDVPFKAVCAGKLLVKRTATGYGGVLVQSCTLNSSAVTIVYGHVRLSSISRKVGDAIKSGEQLGVLGTGYSSETDGERKHLHLGVHKGAAVNILGYVQNKVDLSGWLNALDYM